MILLMLTVIVFIYMWQSCLSLRSRTDIYLSVGAPFFHLLNQAEQLQFIRALRIKYITYQFDPIAIDSIGG